MTTHAIAYVEWHRFRPGDGGVSVFDYGSNQKELLGRVSNGGTLWLVTSRDKTPKRYHLAYKLVNCKAIPPEQSLFSGKEYDYVVRAQDWQQSRHFGYNDATDILRRLQFTSGRPMSEEAEIELRLRNIPELATEDVALLERLQHKIEDGRAVFISYSHEDDAFAAEIEHELRKRDITVSRDAVFLLPSNDWKKAILQEVMSTDSFVVLISPNSAKSRWVKREANWAVKEFKAHGLVKSITPIVLPDGGWDLFSELHCFQRWDYPEPERQQEEFDKLAKGIVLSRRAERGGAELGYRKRIIDKAIAFGRALWTTWRREEQDNSRWR